MSDVRRDDDQLARRLETEKSESSFRPLTSDLRLLSFAGLVVLAGSLYPIPSRTRPSNSPAPMVLSLKTWKSRSLPGLPRTETSSRSENKKAAAASPRRLFFLAL